MGEFRKNYLKSEFGIALDEQPTSEFDLILINEHNPYN